MKRQELGDMVRSALTTIGVTEERISKIIGRHCNCEDRVEYLNRLSRWARRIIAGKTDHAEEYLEEILREQ